MNDSDPRKPLGRKAYGSIAHLPGSRLGPGDHHCHEGQARIATVKARDRHDLIVVQEKTDGSCVSVAKVNDEVIALGRSGYRAITSPYYQHILWDGWVRANYERFDEVLAEGERVVGEWLAQAHGTRYNLDGREPFVLFDIFTPDHERMTAKALAERVSDRFQMAKTLHIGEPLSIEAAMRHVRYEVSVSGEHGWHGALDPVEGVVYRVERRGQVDFLCKYVRPDKVDGAYLANVSGQPDVWNWQPGDDRPGNG